MKREEHIVNVYDRNDNIIGQSTEHINVTKVVRWDHQLINTVEAECVNDNRKEKLDWILDDKPIPPKYRYKDIQL